MRKLILIAMVFMAFLLCGAAPGKSEDVLNKNMTNTAWTPTKVSDATANPCATAAASDHDNLGPWTYSMACHMATSDVACDSSGLSYVGIYGYTQQGATICFVRRGIGECGQSSQTGASTRLPRVCI